MTPISLSESLPHCEPMSSASRTPWKYSDLSLSPRGFLVSFLPPSPSDALIGPPFLFLSIRLQLPTPFLSPVVTRRFTLAVELSNFRMTLQYSPRVFPVYLFPSSTLGILFSLETPFPGRVYSALCCRVFGALLLLSALR